MSSCKKYSAYVCGLALIIKNNHRGVVAVLSMEIFNEMIEDILDALEEHGIEDYPVSDEYILECEFDTIEELKYEMPDWFL